MVSIIVPVYSEGERVRATIKSLWTLEGEKEIIVVDGGSNDNTYRIASETAKEIKRKTPHKTPYPPVCVYQSKQGRGIQLNLGVTKAKGEVLWFVHADSKVDPRSIFYIENTLLQGYKYGCFKMHFYDSLHTLLRTIAWGSHRRAKKHNLLFGDQGVFIEKETFVHYGGFENIPIMEDYAFSKKLTKIRDTRVLPPPCILEIPIGTSARRFLTHGIIFTFLKMQCMKCFYILKFPLAMLCTFYRWHPFRKIPQ